MSLPGSLAGLRILVVEDDFLIALSVQEALEVEGAEVIGPISRIGEALALVRSDPSVIDRALLDVDVQGEKSYVIADALTALGIRFVFTTGYGGEAMTERYRNHPRCEKPFVRRALVDALENSTAS